MPGYNASETQWARSESRRWNCPLQKKLRSIWKFLFSFLCKHIQCKTWPQGCKTFYMLNSTEHEILNAHHYKNIKKFGFFKAQISPNAIFPAHVCYNANNCWHFNIYEQEKFHAQLSGARKKFYNLRAWLRLLWILMTSHKVYFHIANNIPGLGSSKSVIIYLKREASNQMTNVQSWVFCLHMVPFHATPIKYIFFYTKCRFKIIYWQENQQNYVTTNTKRWKNVS